MNEYARKASHILVGALIAALIWVLPREAFLFVISLSLLAGLIIIDLCVKGFSIPVIRQVLDALERKEEIPGKGAFFFVFSSLVLVILFPTGIAAASVLVLAVLDGMATIAGLALGRHRIRNGKTWEGFAGGVITALVVLLPFFPPLSAVLAAVVAGIVELVSPVDDNLVVPFAVAVLLLFIPM